MPGNLLRDRDGDHARVGFAELFYDLVFVFAITQLSHALLAHLTPMGLLETAMLFLATWWAWVNTAWVTNWLDPERTRVRMLLFALMAAGLVASMAIPQAFGDRGTVFAIAFVAVQLGRSLFMVLAVRRADHANYLNFIRISCWLTASGAFWLWGGFSAPEARLPIWAVAVTIECLGPMLRFRIPGLGASQTSDWTVEATHLAERCGLFIIIALGESILVTGATFAGGDWAPSSAAALASAFLGTLAMWWLYFNIGAERASEHFAHAADPGRIARFAYTYLHIPIVAGIVVVAASDEIALKHPTGHADPLQALCLVGGPALYLLGNALFKHATAGWFPLSHGVGLGLAAVLGFFAAGLDPLTLSIGATAILMLTALWETLSLGTGEAPTPAKKELADD